MPDIHIQPRAPPPVAPPPPCVPDPCLPPPPPHRRRRVPRQSGDLPPRVRATQQIFARAGGAVEHCERRRDRVALLDPPFAIACAMTASGIGAAARLAAALRHRLTPRSTARGCTVADPLRIAGALDRARSRRAATSPASSPRPTCEIGVHKAPANGALRLGAGRHRRGRRRPPHGVLNAEHVNAIRAFAGPRPAHLRRAHAVERSRLALRQRPAPAADDREGDRLSMPVGRVRAERLAARARSCSSR